MENIVQVVEGAVGAAEAEAKKIETEVAGKVHAFITKVEEDAKTLASDVERSKLVTELEELLKRLRHPVDAVAQAEKDAEEDAQSVEGAFKRFVRRVWGAVWMVASATTALPEQLNSTAADDSLGGFGYRP